MRSGVISRPPRTGRANACLLLILLFSIRPDTMVGSDKAMQQGTELIEQAENKSNLFVLPSFEMKGNIRISHDGKPLDGSYLFLWNGPAQWREEISFPGYNEVQVGGKGVVFLKRSTDVIPLRIDQLHAALGYGSTPHLPSFIHVAPGPNETIKKIHSRKIDGAKASCVEIVSHERPTREVCGDEATGIFLRQGYFHDRGAIAIDGKLYPHFLSYVQDGKALAEIEITELKAAGKLPPSAFEPPDGGVRKPGCMNPVPARLVNRVAPQYPASDRLSRSQGSVAIYARIASDGIRRDLRVLPA